MKEVVVFFEQLREVRSHSSFFLASSARFLHIAVAQGRRALSYVLARKMNALHMLDVKEHNGQVRRGLAWQPCACATVRASQSQAQVAQEPPNQGPSVNINLEILTSCHRQP